MFDGNKHGVKHNFSEISMELRMIFGNKHGVKHNFLEISMELSMIFGNKHGVKHGIMYFLCLIPCLTHC